jgi:hypothetical protein
MVVIHSMYSSLLVVVVLILAEKQIDTPWRPFSGGWHAKQQQHHRARSFGMASRSTLYLSLSLSLSLSVSE